MNDLDEVYGIAPIKTANIEAFTERAPEELRWSLLGVRYLVTWRGGLERPDGTPIPAEQLYHEGAAPDVTYTYRLAGEPRLAWIVHQVWQAEEDDQLFALLADPSFDFDQIAVVQGPAPSVSPASGDDERVTVVEKTPTRIRLDTEVNSPGLLLLSQTYYPGWKVRVNGELTEVIEANGLLPAVALGAGRSEVVFQYDPDIFYVGLVISGLTTAIGLVLLVRRRRISKALESSAETEA